MTMRSVLGPVFAAECLTTSRRWQVYAGRALLTAALLAGLVMVWLTRVRAMTLTTHQELAVVGSVFWQAIMSVELILALVIVPGATAGAICQDKMHGRLLLMLSTDLSDSEIVLGKLGSRLVMVLGVVACGLPVLAIMTALGGIDPIQVVGGSMVIVGVAILGVCLSMTFSVWATKAHEALMATYAVYAIWLLALPAWGETVPAIPAPGLLYASNPFWLIFGSRWFGPGFSIMACTGFLAGTLVIAAALALISTWRIRAVVIGQSGRSALTERPRAANERGGWHRLGVDDVTLDRDPVLWRERHRRLTSRWGRAIWRVYAGVSMVFIALAVFVNPDVAPGIQGFMVSIGLLMLSVTAATTLAEERALGSLDILMATPLPTRAIVLGKWRGAFRVARRLAILPGILALGTALRTGHWLSGIAFTALMVGMVMAYGAVITSLGLALATWQPRLGRAVGFTVAAFLGVTVLYPTLVIMMANPGPGDGVSLWVSPFFGAFMPMTHILWRPNHLLLDVILAMAVWIALTGVVAYLIVRVTLNHFDRLLGRIPENAEPPWAVNGPDLHTRRLARRSLSLWWR